MLFTHSVSSTAGTFLMEEDLTPFVSGRRSTFRVTRPRATRCANLEIMPLEVRASGRRPVTALSDARSGTRPTGNRGLAPEVRVEMRPGSTDRGCANGGLSPASLGGMGVRADGRASVPWSRWVG